MFYRGSKYGNIPTRCAQGVMHQSKLETKRCNELHVMQAGGLIQGLKAHPQEVYRLDVNGVHIAKYLADFVYYDENGKEVIEDTKGRATEVYRLKARLVKALFGLEIREIRR